MRQIAITAICALAVIAAAGCDNGETTGASRVPAEYGFPADHLELLKQLDEIDFIAMRRHAWVVWAGITHQDAPGDVAVFETWYPADHVFHDSDEPPQHLRSFRTHFEAPKQHLFEAPGESLIAHVMYNQAARDHIRRHKLYIRDTLVELNKTFDSQKTPGWERSVPQFPRDAIVIKPLWWPVKENEPTVLPVWDGPYLPKNGDGLYPPMNANDWPNAVAVIPPGVEAPADPGSLAGTNPQQHVRGTAPLSDFYYFRITEEMLGRLDASEEPGFDHVKAGDYAALVAMHVTTREIASWVWATYWWHDKPDQGHLAEDRPDSIKGVWRHFLMNTAFSMDTPGAPDRGPHITFNPYIEGKFLNGAASNCMACHNRASLPALSQDPKQLCGALPVTRGSYDYQPTSPERRDRVKLEFLWSLLIRSLPGPPACIGAGE